MSVKRLHRLQHELSLGVARHGTEAFAPEVFLGDRRAVQLVQTRFVVKEIDVGGRAVLEKVYDALGLRRKVRSTKSSSLLG